MRREERVTVQGPVKEQQADGMSHRGGGGTISWENWSSRKAAKVSLAKFRGVGRAEEKMPIVLHAVSPFFCFSYNCWSSRFFQML